MANSKVCNIPLALFGSALGGRSAQGLQAWAAPVAPALQPEMARRQKRDKATAPQRNLASGPEQAAKKQSRQEAPPSKEKALAKAPLEQAQLEGLLAPALKNTDRPAGVEGQKKNG